MLQHNANNIFKDLLNDLNSEQTAYLSDDGPAISILLTNDEQTKLQSLTTDELFNSPHLTDNLPPNYAASGPDGKFSILDSICDTDNKDSTSTLNELVNEILAFKSKLFVGNEFVKLLRKHAVNNFLKFKRYNEWKSNFILLCKAALSSDSDIGENNLICILKTKYKFDLIPAIGTPSVELVSMITNDNRLSYSLCLSSQTPNFLIPIDDTVTVNETMFELESSNSFTMLSEMSVESGISVAVFNNNLDGTPITRINIVAFLNQIVLNLKKLPGLEGIDSFIYDSGSNLIKISMFDKTTVLINHPVIRLILTIWGASKNKIIPTKFKYIIDSTKPSSLYELIITDYVISQLRGRCKSFIPIPKDFGTAKSQIFSLSIGYVCFGQEYIEPYNLVETPTPGAVIMYCPIIASLKHFYFSIGKRSWTPNQLFGKFYEADKNELELNQIITDILRKNDIDSPKMNIENGCFTNQKLDKIDSCHCIKSTLVDISSIGITSNYLRRKGKESLAELKGSITRYNNKGTHVVTLSDIIMEPKPRMPTLISMTTSGCSSKIRFSVGKYRWKLFKSNESKPHKNDGLYTIVICSGVASTILLNRSNIRTFAFCYDAFERELDSSVEEWVIERLKERNLYAVSVNELRSPANRKAKFYDQYLERITNSLISDALNLTNVFKLIGNPITHQMIIQEIYRMELSDYLESGSAESSPRFQMAINRDRFRAFSRVSKAYESNNNECIKSATANDLRLCNLQDTIFKFINLYRNGAPSNYDSYEFIRVLFSKRIGHQCLLAVLFRENWITGAGERSCFYCKSKYGYLLQQETCSKTCKGIALKKLET